MIAAGAAIGLLYLAARLGLELAGARFAFRSHAASALADSPVVADGIMLLLLVALWRLAETLRAIASGDLFSVLVIRRFRSFAFWLMLVAVLGLAGPIAAAFVRSPDGGAPVELTLDLRQLVMVGMTLFLFLLARLLERARELEEEAREIV